VERELERRGLDSGDGGGGGEQRMGLNELLIDG